VFGFARRPAAPTQWDSAQLGAALRESPAPLVLDVRSAMEFRARHIPGAQHIPLGQVPGRAAALPAGRTIVCVCLSGHRSLQAAAMIRRAGREAVSLRGGMIRWRGPVQSA